MVYCIVQGCQNDSKYTKGVSYYRLMSQPFITRSQWLEKLNMKKCVFVNNNSVVCSEHFEECCFVRDLKSELLGCRPRRYLKKGSVPTIFNNIAGQENKICLSGKRKRGRPKKLKKLNKESASSTDVTPTENEQIACCVFCFLSSSSNKLGIPEELLECKDCTTKAHPSCMDYTPELAERTRLFPWQCIDCKTCSLCEDAGDADAMLFCDACDRGFHMTCHSPAIKEKPTGKWMCTFCATENGCIKYTENGDIHIKYEITNKIQSCCKIVKDSKSLVPVINENKVVLTCRREKKNPLTICKTKDWTIDDVEKYFVMIGFPKEATSFRDQEIDGKSLLLLKRSDVLTGLSIKLGPALKIYNHVIKLQKGNYN